MHPNCPAVSSSILPRLAVAAAAAVALAAAPATVHAVGGGGGQVIIVQQQPPPRAVIVQQPVLVQQPVHEEGLFGRRNLLTALRIGPSIALFGPLSQAGSTVGVNADLIVGLQTRFGLSFSLHGGLRYHPSDRLQQFDWQIGGLLRYTIVHELVIHPWVEVGADVGGVTNSARSNDSGRAAAFGLRFNAAAGAGIEWDMSQNFSLELGVRADFLFAAHTYSSNLVTVANGDMRTPAVTPGMDILLTPMLGLTWYR